LLFPTVAMQTFLFASCYSVMAVVFLFISQLLPATGLYAIIYLKITWFSDKRQDFTNRSGLNIYTECQRKGQYTFKNHHTEEHIGRPFSLK
jgi:hypothetical protein